MRRFLGLAFLLGAFACAGSADRLELAPEANAPRAIALPHGGTHLGAGDETRSSAQQGAGPKIDLGASAIAPSGACSSDVELRGTPGTVLAQPSVAMLFWGSYWKETGAVERRGYATAWSTIAGDPGFYARLAEYATSTTTIGNGTWAGATDANASLADGALVTESQIQQEIAAEIAAGTAPAATASRIYVVMLPAGVTSQLDRDNNFAGHHSQFTSSVASTPIRYAVITYASDPGYTNPVVSHEITEAITDPDLATGWYDQFGEEVGDLCRFNYGTLDGYAIEKVWSARSCTCVGAESQIPVDAGTPDTGTPDSGTPDTGTPDAGTPDTGVPNTTTCSAPAWTASGVYTGGTKVSFAGKEYTAAYWTQGAEPDTNSGPAGSGQPWGTGTPCSSTTTTTCTPSCDGKTCGADGCGGTCACGAGTTCGSDGTCQAPPTTTTTSSCDGIPAWNPSELWTDYKPNEQHTSNGRKYTCHNVAYCIYEPTSYVGSTYGWTDAGPC